MTHSAAPASKPVPSPSVPPPAVTPVMTVPPPHRWTDDAQGLLAGTLLVGLAALLFRHAHMVTGGTFGLALVLSYASGWRLGVLFFVLNLPFYWLAVRRMGWAFTLKTLAAVTLLSLWTELLPMWLAFERLNPLLAAVLGGQLMGLGLLMLFRHRASLGGLNVLVILLQETRGWSAGLIQMAVDVVIVVLALLVAPWQAVALSVLGAVVLNAVLAMNHRQGRYQSA